MDTCSDVSIQKKDLSYCCWSQVPSGGRVKVLWAILLSVSNIVKFKQINKNNSTLIVLAITHNMYQNKQKGQAIIWVVVGLAIIAGVYMFESLGTKTSTTNNQITQTISPTPEVSTIITPMPTVVSDSQLDAELKKLNSDSANLDKSLKDSPIDVMQ